MTVAVAPTCTACGLCLVTCPAHALRPAPRRPDVVDALCTDCGDCVEICPVGAIVLTPADRTPASPGGAPPDGSPPDGRTDGRHVAERTARCKATDAVEHQRAMMPSGGTPKGTR